MRHPALLLTWLSISSDSSRRNQTGSRSLSTWRRRSSRPSNSTWCSRPKWASLIDTCAFLAWTGKWGSKSMLGRFATRPNTSAATWSATPASSCTSRVKWQLSRFWQQWMRKVRCSDTKLDKKSLVRRPKRRRLANLSLRNEQQLKDAPRSSQRQQLPKARIWLWILQTEKAVRRRRRRRKNSNRNLRTYKIKVLNKKIIMNPMKSPKIIQNWVKKTTRRAKKTRKSVRMMMTTSTKRSMETKMISLLAIIALPGRLSEEALKTKVKFRCLSCAGLSACMLTASSTRAQFHYQWSKLNREKTYQFTMSARSLDGVRLSVISPIWTKLSI